MTDLHGPLANTYIITLLDRRRTAGRVLHPASIAACAGAEIRTMSLTWTRDRHASIVIHMRAV